VATKLIPFDAAKYLDDAQSQAELLAEALETGDSKIVAHALGVIARARGMTEIAREAGVSRESLYKSLSLDGNPELATVLAVAKALNLKLTAEPAKDGGREAA
jgi:probable addiction module antidote protein